MEDLRAVVQRVAELPLDGVEPETLQSFAVILHAAIGRMQGKLDEVLSALDVAGAGHVSDGGHERSVQGWWRDAAGLTGQQSGTDLRRSRVLRDLPLIGQAVVDGTLSPEQAAVLARLHGRMPLAELRESQEHLIQAARPQPTDALARWVALQVATHNERALERDEAAAHARRYFQTRTELDGSIRGSFVLAREDAEVLHSVLEPLARRQDLTDPRTAGQRRADALVDVFHAASKWMDLPYAGGQRAQVAYVVTSDWCADRPVAPLAQRLSTGLHPLASARHAAEGAWTGPQTRARIETVLCDTRLSRLLLSSDSQVLRLESISDEITSAQRKAVSARDRSCVAKGCARTPAFCDVHHLVHRADGGPTEVHNLVLLCRRHHLKWHRGQLTRADLHTPWLDRGGTAPGEGPETWEPPLTA